MHETPHPPALLRPHLLPAGTAEAPEQSVDHLDGAEDALQTRRRQQSGKERHVELDNVLWLYTPAPQVFVVQVAPRAKKQRGVTVMSFKVSSDEWLPAHCKPGSVDCT